MNIIIMVKLSLTHYMDVFLREGSNKGWMNEDRTRNRSHDVVSQFQTWDPSLSPSSSPADVHCKRLGIGDGIAGILWVYDSVWHHWVLSCVPLYIYRCCGMYCGRRLDRQDQHLLFMYVVDLITCKLYSHTWYHVACRKRDQDFYRV